MADNISASLSTALLIKSEIDLTPKLKSQLSEDLASQSLPADLVVPGSLTLLQRAKAIETLLNQDFLDQALGPDKIDLLLTSILDLERSRSLDQRLDLAGILFLSAIALKKKSPTGDRLEMALEEVRRLESQSDLKLKIATEMEGQALVIGDSPRIGEARLVAVNYEDIMELEVNRFSKYILSGHTMAVNSIAMTADSRFIVSGSDDNSVRVWSIPQRIEVFALVGHTSEVTAVAVSTDCRLVASSSADRTIKIWDFQERIEKCTLSGHTGAVRSVVMDSECRFIVSGSDDSTIRMWDIQQQRELCTLAGHTGSVLCLALARSNDFIFSGSADATIKLWNIQNKKAECTLAGHTGKVLSLSVSPDSMFLVSGSADTTVKIWDLHKRREDFTLSGHSHEVCSVSVSPDQQLIVSAASNKQIKVWNIQKRRLERTLVGHADSVRVVVFSPDSTFLVSGSADTKIRFWKMQDATNRTLFGHSSEVWSVDASKDSRYLVSGSEDKTIKIWNIQEDREECTLIGHTGGLRAVALASDCKFIVSGGTDKTVRIWDFQARKAVAVLTGHSAYVRTVALSPDNRYIVSGSADNTLKIWSMQERREECTLTGHHKTVISVAISSDGKLIVSGSADSTIKIWSFLERQEVCTLVGHTNEVNTVVFSPDLQLIVSGADDKTIRIWSVQERREERVLTRENCDIRSVTVSADGRFIVAGLNSGHVKVWNLKDYSEEFVLAAPSGNLLTVAVSNDFQIIGGGDGGYIKLWRMQEQKKNHTLTGHTQQLWCAVVSEDSRLIVSSSSDSSIRIWNLKERKQEYALSGHRGVWVQAVAISSDNRFIVSGARDGSIKLWSIETQSEEFTFTGHSNYIRGVAISNDCKFIVSGSADTTIKIWNIQEKKEEFTLIGHRGPVISVAISSDNKLIASGSADFSIRIWSVQEQKEKNIFSGHTDEVNSVVFSANSKFIVSCSDDRTIKIWNLLELREEYTFAGHTGVVMSVALTPDNRFIVSGSSDKTIRIWNIQEKKEERALTEHTGMILSVFVSPDGRQIVSASNDKTIKIWETQELRNELMLIEGHSSRKNVTTIDGRYIISRSLANKIHLWNVQLKQYEKFSLKIHENLLKYIVVLSDTVNHLTICQVYATSNFLILGSAIEVFEIILIENGDLQFSYDIGSYFSKTPFTEYCLPYYASGKDFAIIPSWLAPASSDPLRFTLAHYYCYQGNRIDLKKLIELPNFSIQTDAFCKSPFYYAILKNREDCVEALLERLDTMRVENSPNFQTSVCAIRDDISLIIKTSPKCLQLLLNNLFILHQQAYAKISRNLPIYQVGFTQIPQLSDFPCDGSEEVPVIIQASRFPLIGESGCLHNAALLSAIIACNNVQALRCPIIHHIVQMQFDAVKPGVISYTFLLCANIISLMLMIGFSFNFYFVAPFLLVNVLLFTWELVQVIVDPSEYLQDYWNYLDIIRNLTSVIWIITELCGWSSVYFTWTVALLNFLRGITVFRLFDGTRFYIELIIRSLNDIKYFFMMFAYSTVTFGCLLMISREEGMNFSSVWEESYDLNFGNYDDPSNGVFFLKYIAYFGATIINVVLMLNLLISILGDSYDRFQLEQGVVDIKEKAIISLELQSMMFWANKHSPLKYMRLCDVAFQREDGQDWEGRIRFMDKKLDNNLKELSDRNREIGLKIDESSKAAESNAEKNNQFIGNRISLLEHQFREAFETLEEKRKSGINSLVEEQIGRLEARLETTASQVVEINQKMEMLLSILSK